MKQIIFGAVIALLLSGFFVEEALANINGANGAKGEDGIKGTSGKTIIGKNGASANHHAISNTVGSGD